MDSSIFTSSDPSSSSESRSDVSGPSGSVYSESESSVSDYLADYLAAKITRILILEANAPVQRVENNSLKPVQLNYNIISEVIHISRIQNIDVVKPFLEEIQCPICYNVLISPQYCKRCGKSFCQQCYGEWIRKQKETCPCCRDTVSITPDVPKLLLSLLSKLKLFCQNKEQGCKQIIDYDSLKKHRENECLYVSIECKNIGCTISMKRQDADSHYQICAYQLIFCSKCGLSVKRKEVENHTSLACPRRNRLSQNQELQMIQYSREKLRQNIRQKQLEEELQKKRQGNNKK